MANNQPGTTTRLGIPNGHSVGIQRAWRAILVFILCLTLGFVLLLSGLTPGLPGTSIVLAPPTVAASIVLVVLALLRMNAIITTLRRSVARERILRQISTDLVGASSHERIWQVALAAVPELLHGHATPSIRIAEHFDKHLTVVAASGAGAPEVVGTRINRQALPGNVQEALRAQQHRRIDLDTNSGFPLLLNIDARLRSLLFTPICIGTEARATILVASAKHLTDDACDNLEMLASQVAVALESADNATNLHRRRREERFRALVQNASDMITVTDAHGVIRYASSSVERLLGYRPNELVGVTTLAWIHEEDLGRMQSYLASVSKQPGVASPIEVRVFHSDGTWRHAEAIANNLLDDPNVNGIVFTTRDISERIAFQDQLVHQANHDLLTALPNRRLFMDRLQQALLRNSRRRTGVAVLFMDLDRFKLVNDSLGHETGDLLLQSVADRLSHCVRPGDIAARFGGDEFAVLLENINDASDAVEVTERILHHNQEVYRIGEYEMFVNASIGIAISTSADDQPSDLLRNADIAMYQAKNTGKGRYALWDSTMNANMATRLEMEHDLRRAIDRAEFMVYYQPKVELATGKLVGVEALVRWQHPMRGLIMPTEFIDIAEETGMILAIGRWVLLQSCRQARTWQQRYPEAKQLVISVNLSARQFTQPDLVEDIASVLAETGLQPSCLRLEITESVVMEDAATTIGKLTALKQLGVQLAIDDFGTGYSSLSYLKRFPVDCLKIDRAFVGGLATNTEDSAIVQAVMSLAHSLGLTVTAEGIESAEVWANLRMLGCELGQGYFFARPLSSEATDALLLPGAGQWAVSLPTAKLA